MTLDQKIEAILFHLGELISISKLSEFLKTDKDDIEEGLKKLEEKLSDRGITIVRYEDKVMIGTKAEASPIISELNKDELNRELGKAGLETLSIILYRGPINKKEIDYIRGVNSSYIIRNLLIRGLVEKTEKKSRSAFYQPTVDLLTFLGISKIEEMPEFSEVKKELESLSLEEGSGSQEQ